MTDPPPPTNAEKMPAAPPKMPRWVKIFGIVAALIVLVALAALIFGGGQHGPGRHASPQTDTTPPHEGGNHTRPPGHHEDETQVAEGLELAFHEASDS